MSESRDTCVPLSSCPTLSVACPGAIRVKISDGEQYGIGMLTSDCAQLVLTEQLRVNACVKLKQYMINQIQATK